MELSVSEMGNLILHTHMARNMWPSPQPGHKVSSDNSSPFQLFSFSSLTFLIQACPQEKLFYQNLTDLGEGKYPIQAHKKPENLGTIDVFPQPLLSTTSIGFLHHDIRLNQKEFQDPDYMKENTEDKPKVTRRNFSL